MDIEVRRKEQFFGEENNRRIELRGLLQCYLLRGGWGRFQMEGVFLENTSDCILSFHIEKIVRNSCNISRFFLSREFCNYTGEMVLMT
jgi:hypothetical protein